MKTSGRLGQCSGEYFLVSRQGMIFLEGDKDKILASIHLTILSNYQQSPISCLGEYYREKDGLKVHRNLEEFDLFETDFSYGIETAMFMNGIKLNWSKECDLCGVQCLSINSEHWEREASCSVERDRAQNSSRMERHKIIFIYMKSLEEVIR